MLALTLDGELSRLGRAQSDTLVLKVDVEGHEIPVLEGAREAIRAGRVHTILLEYGDKMSPEIFAGMKANHVAKAAAASPQQLQGLHWLRGYADAHGFDVYLLGASQNKPVLIGVSGELWDDGYEARHRPRCVCPRFRGARPELTLRLRCQGVSRQARQVEP